MADDYGVHVQSTLDLRFMALKAKCIPGKLSKMCNDYLNISLDKSSSSQFSNWEAPTLCLTQIEYAATDVYAAMELFEYFAKKITPELNSSLIHTIADEFINQNYGPERYQKIQKMQEFKKIEQEILRQSKVLEKLMTHFSANN